MSLNGGYAMIKYNSTQEELQIAYRSKRPVLFYDENQRSHRAVIEETATESVDEETQEPITIYEYSYKLLNDIEALVDKNGNHRFFEIPSTPGVKEGMNIYYGKCVLNGNNLIFEISGIFSKDMPSDFTLCKFTLPDWIAQRIPLGYANVVDVSTYNIIYSENNVDITTYRIYKEGNILNFFQGQAISIVKGAIFRIRYNIIIDN